MHCIAWEDSLDSLAHWGPPPTDHLDDTPMAGGMGITVIQTEVVVVGAERGRPQVGRGRWVVRGPGVKGWGVYSRGNYGCGWVWF